MTRESLWETWAPDDSPWSAWAKPVLFALMPHDPWLETADLPTEEAAWAPDPSAHTAIVVDLPGPTSVAVGVGLARRGYRPVPLFNGCRGAGETVDTDLICHALVRWGRVLAGLAVPANGPPAFLLDAGRGGEGRRPGPGDFDNRWIVFPQDFPSANLLLSKGIRSAIHCSSRPLRASSDVAHVLKRWQDAGIRVLLVAPGQGTPVETLVPEPSRFRRVWYRALALMGFGRSAAGGFGVRVPRPPPSGGGWYGGGFH